MSIKESIKKAIQENLSSVVAGELADYITKAEDDKLVLQRLQERCQKLSNDYDSLVITNKKLETLVKKEEDLVIREEALKNSELNLKVLIAEEKTKEAEKRADGIYRLAETVFKNRSLTNNKNESVPVYVPYQGGGGFHENRNSYSVTTQSDTENDTI